MSATTQKTQTLRSTNQTFMSWPEIESRYVGKTFRRRKDGKQETWRVVDCTIGGDVCIRWGRAHYSRQIPQAAFLEWVKDATLLPS